MILVALRQKKNPVTLSDYSAFASYLELRDRRAATLRDMTAPDPVLSTTNDFRRSLKMVNKSDLNADEQAVLNFTHAGILAVHEESKRIGARNSCW